VGLYCPFFLLAATHSSQMTSFGQNTKTPMTAGCSWTLLLEPLPASLTIR
jgi:hypothetical protein